MKRAAALVILGAAGCWYDRPNPWDTSEDRGRLQERTHEDWRLDLDRAFEAPQEAPPSLLDPALEAWRDTVLAHADERTLALARARSAARIAGLEDRRAELLRLDELTRRTPLREIEEELRTERIRLRLLEERLRS